MKHTPVGRSVGEPAALIDRLGRLRSHIVDELGKQVLVEQLDKYTHDDGSEGPFVPGLVVRPTERGQVVSLVAWCYAHGVPLSPRGAGTGTVGGCLADHGGVVLDLSGLDRIIVIDEPSMLVEAEPGVVTALLHCQVESRGLLYPPDPASLKTCTIGGNVATNAGGPRACKYGVTGHFVLGLDVVTGTGESMFVGHRSIKGVTGYDLARLLVGSEGTLAVVTGCVLRLVSRPEHTATLLASFPDEHNACEVVRACFHAGLQPSALELADRTCTRLLRDSPALSGVLDHGDAASALLWIEMDGNVPGVTRAAERAQDACQTGGAIDVRIALENDERERLWEARRALSPALRARYSGKLSEDVAVPLGNIAPLLERVRRIAHNHQLEAATFGHAGDGNLHVNFLFDRERAADGLERAQRAAHDLFTAALALAGTLSGEHGIGLAKRSFLPLEQSRGLRGLQLELKRVWDPGNILNPGKIFP